VLAFSTTVPLSEITFAVLALPYTVPPQRLLDDMALFSLEFPLGRFDLIGCGLLNSIICTN
jgi:hypothetical protein